MQRRQPICISVEGDKIVAKEITFGADNALGLAYSLAILTLKAAAGSVESSIMEIKEELRLCGFSFYVLKISE